MVTTGTYHALPGIVVSLSHWFSDHQMPRTLALHRGGATGSCDPAATKIYLTAFIFGSAKPMWTVLPEICFSQQNET